MQPQLVLTNGHLPRFFTILNSTTNRCPGMLPKNWNGISRRKRPTTKDPRVVTASWRRMPLLHARGSFRCRNCLAEAIALTSFAPESDLCKNAQAFVGCEPVLNHDWLYGTDSRVSFYRIPWNSANPSVSFIPWSVIVASIDRYILKFRWWDRMRWYTFEGILRSQTWWSTMRWFPAEVLPTKPLTLKKYRKVTPFDRNPCCSP